MSKKPLIQGLLSLSLLMMVACQPSGTPTQTTPSPGTSTEPSVNPSAQPGTQPSGSPTPTGGSPGATPTPEPVASGTIPITAPSGTPVVDFASIASIEIKAGNRFLNGGKGSTTQIEVILRDKDGKIVTIDASLLEWVNSRPTNFSIDAKGLVTALLDEGYTTITVTEPKSGKSASIQISISDPTTGSSGGGGGGGGGGSTSTPTPTPVPTPFPSPSENLSLNLNMNGLGLDEFHINTKTGNEQDNARVAIDADGDFVVSWVDSYDLGDVYNRTIKAQRFNAQGMPQGREINVDTFQYQGDRFNNGEFASYKDVHDVSMDADGNFIVVWDSWHQDGDEYGLYAQRYFANGTPNGGEFLVNEGTEYDQYNPQVAMDTDGDFVVTWEQQEDSDQYQVFMRSFDKYASPRSSDINLSTQNYVFDSDEDHEFPAIDMNDNGDIAITWTVTYEDGLYQYGFAGAKFSEADLHSNSALEDGFTFDSDEYGDGDSIFQGSEDYDFETDVALNNNGSMFVVMSPNDNDLDESTDDSSFVALFDPNDSSPDNVENFSYWFNDGDGFWGPIAGLRVADDNDSRFVLTWQGGQDEEQNIFAQVLDYNNSYSSVFQINTDMGDSEGGDNDRDEPHVAMNPEGEMVIVWEADDNHPMDESSGVFGKVFDSNGNAR